MYYISLPYATFGIIAENNIVIDAAPIAKWMIGKHLIREVKQWLISKKAKVIELENK